MEQVSQGRFQFSIRTLLLVTAALAVSLVPVSWVARERQRMMRAQEAMLQAREVALRSVVLEGQRRRGATRRPAAGIAEGPASQPGDRSSADQSPVIEQLRRENSALRQQVESLRFDLQRLRDQAKTINRPSP
jgi:hypothetical protein